MTVAGIIAEYNPFHNGHLFHIEETRRLTGCSHVIVIMSGSFVQRGAPALIDKHLRAKMALCHGADLVLELPCPYASASAERFATGAVEILDRLNMVDMLSFGSENTDLEQITRTANALCEETPDFSKKLQKGLQTGLTFAQARAAALPAEYAALLSRPNTLLGVEYCRALRKRHSPIRPLAVPRRGSGHHDTGLTGPAASASALRGLFQHTSFKNEIPRQLSRHMPADAADMLYDRYRQNGLVFTDDFSQLLQYRILLQPDDALLACPDVSPELLNRIRRCQYAFASFNQFADLLKTRNMTHSRIRRSLIQILLNIHGYPPINEVRVLGFRRESASLLSEIHKKSSLRLLTSQNESTYDISADILYDMVQCRKTERDMIPEWSKPLQISGKDR